MPIRWGQGREMQHRHSKVRSVLRSMRASIAAHELATDADVADWLEALDEARSVPYRTFLFPLYIEMIAQVP